MKGYTRRNKHGHMVTTFVDGSGRAYGKLQHRTTESYDGYVLTFKELNIDGHRRVRGVATRPPNKQIFRYAMSKDHAIRLLKRAIDEE